METQRTMITLLITLGILLISVSPVLAVPPLPSSFYGTVKINTENVPGDALVTATINRVQYVYTTVQIYQGHTVYSLDIPGDDPSTTGVTEGGVTGDTIVFLINGVPGNETAVWQTGTNVIRNLTIIPPAPPVVTITGPVDDALLAWEEVTTNPNGNPTVVTDYQVFRDEQPYFTPDPTPVTGNLVDESLALEYLHQGVMTSLANYFYIVRACNLAGPSTDSGRVGKFSFPLVQGQ